MDAETAARRNVAEFGYSDIIAIADSRHRIVAAAGARATPQAAVIVKGGEVAIGRIDNRYAAVGKPRIRATTHDLREALDAIVAGRPVTHRETPAVGCFIPRLLP